jgi:hypothetical protein
MLSFVSVGGVAGFVAISGLLIAWTLFWLATTMICGTFFDLPGKMTAAVGAILGPLGLVTVIFVGISEKKPHEKIKSTVSEYKNRNRSVATDQDDPFA